MSPVPRRRLASDVEGRHALLTCLPIPGSNRRTCHGSGPFSVRSCPWPRAGRHWRNRPPCVSRDTRYAADLTCARFRRRTDLRPASQGNRANIRTSLSDSSSACRARLGRRVDLVPLNDAMRVADRTRCAFPPQPSCFQAATNGPHTPTRARTSRRTEGSLPSAVSDPKGCASRSSPLAGTFGRRARLLTSVVCGSGPLWVEVRQVLRAPDGGGQAQ